MSEPPTSSLKTPKEIHDFLLYRLFRVVSTALRGTDAMYRHEPGVSRREWRVLAYLAMTPDANLKTLASDAAMDMTVASRCVTAMVRRGLVVKQRDAASKRQVSLRLTDLGLEMHDKAKALGTHYNKFFAACLSDEEAETLERLLRKLEHQAEVVSRHSD